MTHQPLILPEGEFSGLIFDCDGTLADTMPAHYQAWRAALAEYRAELPEALFYELGGVPTERIVEMLNTKFGHNMPPAEVALRKEHFFLEYSKEVLPIQSVVAVAREYAGKVPMAVASGGRRRLVTKSLNAIGITSLFQAIVCAEDYKHGKPAPDPFLKAAELIGVEPAKCLVFEDTELGVDAAKAAGMQWVLVPPPVR
ncbi:MAG: HAD-IA family hydrolase [Chthoniobacteraceae bacterium]